MAWRRRTKVPAVKFDRYEHTTRVAIVWSEQYARKAGQPRLGTEHVVCGLTNPAVRARFALFLPTVDDVWRLMTERGRVIDRDVGSDHLPFDEEMREIIVATFATADAQGRREIGPEHLLLTVLERPTCFGARLLLDLGIDPSRDAAAWRVDADEVPGPDAVSGTST